MVVNLTNQYVNYSYVACMFSNLNILLKIGYGQDHSFLFELIWVSKENFVSMLLWCGESSRKTRILYILVYIYISLILHDTLELSLNFIKLVVICSSWRIFWEIDLFVLFNTYSIFNMNVKIMKYNIHHWICFFPKKLEYVF